MSYLGDLRLGDTLDFKFCSVQSTGAPTTLSGVPVISAYPSNSTTQLTAGITLTVDFDTVTGLNHVRVVASSGNGYATATNYDLVITTGTVNSISAVGYVVGTFSIENRSAVMPTVGGHTLDVTATGAAGVDWGNVESPTTTNGLTGTTISTSQVAASVTGAVGSVTGAVGSVTGAVGSVASGGIARASFAADTGLQSIRSNTAQAGAGTTITLDAAASATNSFYNNTLILLTGGTGAGQARFITAYVGATKVATVATWATNPDSSTTFAILPFDAVAGATAPTAAQIATAVWQDLTSSSDFTTASSIGKLLVTDLDAAISSRMATFTLPTNFSSLVIDSTGRVNAFLIGILTSVFTEGATGRIAAAFKQFFNIATPAATMDHGVLVDTVTTATTTTNTTNAPTAGDFTATMKTSIGTAVAASAVASVTAGVALTSGERNSVADALLDRDMSVGTDSGSPTVRTVRQALRFLRNKWSITGGTLTVTKENDTTSSWTGSVTQTAGNPVSTIDPA